MVMLIILAQEFNQFHFKIYLLDKKNLSQGEVLNNL
jgi:hypothetical protein